MLHELEAQGLHNETIVVFIGDHGWQLGDLGEFGKKVRRGGLQSEEPVLAVPTPPYSCIIHVRVPNHLLIN